MEVPFRVSNYDIERSPCDINLIFVLAAPAGAAGTAENSPGRKALSQTTRLPPHPPPPPPPNLREQRELPGGSRRMVRGERHPPPPSPPDDVGGHSPHPFSLLFIDAMHQEGGGLPLVGCRFWRHAPREGRGRGTAALQAEGGGGQGGLCIPAHQLKQLTAIWQEDCCYSLQPA